MRTGASPATKQRISGLRRCCSARCAGIRARRVVMGVVLLVGGMRFFSMHQTAAGAEYLDCSAAELQCWPAQITFSIGPVLSFLEGCGQVAQVARMRFFQSTVSVAAIVDGDAEPSWIVCASDGAAGAGIRGMHSAVFAAHAADAAVADACGAHGDQLAARSVALPVEDRGELALRLLHLSAVYAGAVCVSRAGGGGEDGPLDEYRMQLSAMMLAWMTTKAAPFGSLIAKKDTPELDRMFFRSLRQSIALFVGAAVLVLDRCLRGSLHLAEGEQSH